MSALSLYILPLSVLPLPLPLHKIILDYCSYLKKYLSELTRKTLILKEYFDRFENYDVSRTSLVVSNIILIPTFNSLKSHTLRLHAWDRDKANIVARLFDRENDRRKEFGLLANEGIYNYNVGSSLTSINY